MTFHLSDELRGALLLALTLLGITWLVMVLRDLRARLAGPKVTLDLNDRPMPLAGLHVTFRAEPIPTVTLTGTLGAPALYHHTLPSLIALCVGERSVAVRFTWQGEIWCANGTLIEVTETRSGVPCFTVRASYPAIEGAVPPSSAPPSSDTGPWSPPRSSAPPAAGDDADDDTRASEPPSPSATVDPDLKHGASSGVSTAEETPPDTKPTGR